MTEPIAELIAGAPWGEAVTYRETWPHEYVLTEKDNQRELRWTPLVGQDRCGIKRESRCSANDTTV